MIKGVPYTMDLQLFCLIFSMRIPQNNFNVEYQYFLGACK